jgi:signal transduction histidine kinase
VLVYLALMAVVARTFADEANRPLLSWYLGFELAFLLLYTVMLYVHKMPGWLEHACLILQSALVLYALSWRPEFDFLVLFFQLLTLPVVILFTGKTRWMWIFLLVLLIGGSLVYFLGIVRGLSLSLTTMAGAIVLPAFLVVSHEIETARLKSQVLLTELEESHRQLQIYASQVQELAAMRERNRLARELHDTVSQLMFSINLTTSSAQLLLKKDPTRIPEQLSRLQEMTTEALSRLRSLISQLRPPQKFEAQQ